jgi:hypothetical protein
LRPYIDPNPDLDSFRRLNLLPSQPIHARATATAEVKPAALAASLAMRALVARYVPFDLTDLS